jgi:preprotein translocase subunit SecG
MPPTKAWNNFKFNYPLGLPSATNRSPRFLSQQLYNRQTAHHIPALMWLSIVIPILLSILAIVCILLTLVVLMQRPKNEGLGAAFGSGVTENIFGAQTATVLTKATVYLGCIFFGLTLLLTVLTARQSSDRRVGVLESEVRKAAALPKPTTSPAVASSPALAASPATAAAPVTAASPAVPASPATAVSPTATASPEASPSATVSPTPAASSTPEPSPTPSGSVSPSPSVTTEASPTTAPSTAPSASPQK